MFYVYVIRSQTVGKIYIGHTQDLEKRLRSQVAIWFWLGLCDAHR